MYVNKTMIDSNRTENTKRNILAGIIKQIASIIMPFIVRTIVIYSLGELYQGLSGLFTSILQMLSLADLGFSSVIIYILYKPISEKNTTEICAIIAFLRNIYKIVGFTVLGIGLLIMPFLPVIINGNYPDNINIYVVYVLYLCNSVISYFFFAYKTALLTALQKESIVSNANTLVLISSRVIQSLVLLLTHNYYLFVIVLILGSILTNIIIQILSNKYFPDLQPKGKVHAETTCVFKKQIKAIMINRIADVARNSLDNIILSTLFGLSIVAAYDNYYYIFTALYGFSLVIVHGMQASVGNSIVEEGFEKNYRDLLKFNFIYSLITGLCTVCMVCAYQPFMNIWMSHKKNLILDDATMILFCIYFYAITANNIRNLYINGKGLFYEIRWWYIIESASNLILNILLGKFIGVKGIIIATIITIIVCNFFARTIILFKNYFKISSYRFFIENAKYFAVTFISGLVSYLLTSYMSFNPMLNLICSIITAVFVYSLLCLLFYRKSVYKDELVKVFKKRIYGR